MNFIKYMLFIFIFSQSSISHAQNQLPRNSVHFDSFEDSLPLNTIYQIPPPATTLPSTQLSAVNFTFDDPRITAGMLYSVKIDGVDAVDCLFKIMFKIVQCQMFSMPAVGTHKISVKIGNYTHKWNFEAVAPPMINFISPPPNSTFNIKEIPEIVANIKSTELLTFKDVELSFNSLVTTAGVVLTQVNSREVGLKFKAKNQSLGQSEVMISAFAPSGLSEVNYLTYTVEADKDYSVEFIDLPQRVTSPSLTVKLNVHTGDSFVDRVAINDALVNRLTSVEQTSTFSAEILLVPGENPVQATVKFQDGTEKHLIQSVFYETAPVIKVTLPADFSVFGALSNQSGSISPGGALNLTGGVERPILITGTTDQPVVSVLVNQQAAAVAADGLSFRLVNFFLHEGTNHLNVAATDSLGNVGSQSITVYVDQTAPILTIVGPFDRSITSANRIDIVGTVSDPVRSYLSATLPAIRAENSLNGVSVPGTVESDSFLIENLPLEVGDNEISVVAVDQLGNPRTRSIHVTRILVGSKRIVLSSGNKQLASASAELPEAIVVMAIDQNGDPLAAMPIRFDIVRGSGSIRRVSGQVVKPDGVNPARHLEVMTGSDGVARTWLKVGEEAGAGANVVRVWSPELAEEVVITAGATKGSPYFILADDAAGLQFAQTSSAPIDPLSVVVYDINANPFPGATVTYSIQSGDATFNAQSGAALSPTKKEISLSTDYAGRVSVRPQLGAQPGLVEIFAMVRLAGNDGVVGPAIFRVSSIAGAPGNTQLSGRVLDHTGKALPGVRMSISRTNLSATSDATGLFKFSSNLPAGKLDLFIDGRDVNTVPNIQFPALHFEVTVVQGQNNQMPTPIYLPPINLMTSTIVGGSQDVSITLPEFEGFEMLIKAGSVTFPDGTHVGPLVVSPVNGDRLPMVPPGGWASFGALAWTIQPAGTRFDPPIQVKIPNATGMRPGRSRLIYQWDHELAAFVPIGRAVVSEDGSQIISEPGSGISKAGWGGGPPPQPPNCTEYPAPACRGGQCCAACKTTMPSVGSPLACMFRACENDFAQEGLSCQDSPCRRCNNGLCTPFNGSSEVVSIMRPDMFMPGIYDATSLTAPEGGRTHGSYQWTETATNGGKEAKWNFEIDAFCKQNGKWGFKITQLRIDSFTSILTPNPTARATNRQVDILLGRNPDDPQANWHPHFGVDKCTALNTVEYTIFSGNNEVYENYTNSNAPLVSCMDAFQFVGPWLLTHNRDSVIAHERIHYQQAKEDIRTKFSELTQKMTQLELPIAQYSTASLAVEALKKSANFKNTVLNFMNSVGAYRMEVNPDAHKPYQCYFKAQVQSPSITSVLNYLAEIRSSMPPCSHDAEMAACRLLVNQGTGTCPIVVPE